LGIVVSNPGSFSFVSMGHHYRSPFSGTYVINGATHNYQMGTGRKVAYIVLAILLFPLTFGVGTYCMLYVLPSWHKARWVGHIEHPHRNVVVHAPRPSPAVVLHDPTPSVVVAPYRMPTVVDFTPSRPVRYHSPGFVSSRPSHRPYSAIRTGGGNVVPGYRSVVTPTGPRLGGGHVPLGRR